MDVGAHSESVISANNELQKRRLSKDDVMGRPREGHASQ